MNRFEKMKALVEEIKVLAKKHNVTVITAQQPKRKGPIRTGMAGLAELPDVIYIDYIDPVGPKGED